MRRPLLAIALATCSLVFLTGPSAADGVRAKRVPDRQAINPSQGTDYPTTVQETRPGGPAVVLPIGTSTQFHLSGDQSRISIADPEIADVQPVTRREIIVFAKKPGTTSLYVHNEAGDILLSRNVESLGPTILMRGDKIGEGPSPQFLIIPTQPASPGQSVAPSRTASR
jgi:Flp pilus assembly secretin CpaC